MIPLPEARNAAARGAVNTTGERNDHDGNGPDDQSTASAATVAFRDAYAVLVRGKSVRRRLFLSIAAAERTVKRAHARGAFAEMVLVKMVPVDVRHLDCEVSGDE